MLSGHYLWHSARGVAPFRSLRRSHTASPEHSEYQVIKSYLNRNVFWRTLVEEPALAGSVRRLSILPSSVTAAAPAWVRDESEMPTTAFREYDDSLTAPEHGFTSDEQQSQTIQRLQLSEKLLVDALQ